MILDSWKPDPFPEIVVPVPSRAHPDLVPDFARRLAAVLSIEYLPAVIKVRDTQPQKTMQNSAHQARNIEDAFIVSKEHWGSLQNRAVLLVDDLVDSRWTMTTISVLLNQAEARIVYPFALACSSRGDT